MFWDSVIRGLLFAFHPRVILASVGYLVVLHGPNAIIQRYTLKAFVNSNSEDDNNAQPSDGSRAPSGCLWIALSLGMPPLLQSIAISGFITHLVPLLLFGSEVNSVRFILSHIGTIVVVGVAATVTTLILSFLPIVGKLISTYDSVAVFIQGIIAFRIMSYDALRGGGFLARNSEIYPGVLTCIGFLIATIVFAFVVFTLFDIIRHRLPPAIEALVQPILGPVSQVILGFIPLFMYISHVHASIAQIVNVGW